MATGFSLYGGLTWVADIELLIRNAPVRPKQKEAG